MPPRLPALQGLGNINLCLRQAIKPSNTAADLLPTTQTASLTTREKKRIAKQDPYRWAQAQQRKSAHLQRRNQIERERNATWGDPVWGKTTPFLQSLDSAGQSPLSEVPRDAEGNPTSTPIELPNTPGLRVKGVTDQELDEVLKQAYVLTKPLVGAVESQLTGSEAEQRKAHDKRHAQAKEAMQRITALSNSSSRDRFHTNVARIINEFGRHETDQKLRPKPRGPIQEAQAAGNEKPPRAGPDTGSSEVQIAILTAKIRSLGQALQGHRAHKDKHNTRNLRLLVHRRQKLLKYMEKKERGSERWTHMLEKLGLTPATWKGEITV
ncbi:ribosomal protein s15 domain-containing protein [Sarocladium implicatum]|nr:ribosomal protein s15 domain-containing protein [Sarocladium implicatum]